MKNGTTGSGFVYEFDEERANDMMVLQRIVTLTDDEAPALDKVRALTALPGMLLGQEQADRLYAHLAQIHGGRVPPAALEKDLTEILGGSAAGKN